MSPLINQAGIDTKIRLNLTVKEKWVEILQEAEARIIEHQKLCPVVVFGMTIKNFFVKKLMPNIYVANLKNYEDVKTVVVTSALKTRAVISFSE